MEVDEVPAQADGDYKRRETGREFRISMTALSCYSTKTDHRLWLDKNRTCLRSCADFLKGRVAVTAAFTFHSLKSIEQDTQRSRNPVKDGVAEWMATDGGGSWRDGSKSSAVLLTMSWDMLGFHDIIEQNKCISAYFFVFSYPIVSFKVKW